ncbi:MAG: hypothetical protein NTY80_01725 [candidate division SR1 bacterium]|nr:hypothetical protein [candidate division SR1 bacterium]
MAVEKIIYVTPGEEKLGELTQVAKAQFKKLIQEVFSHERGKNIVLRMSEENNQETKSLSLIYNAVGKDIGEGEAIYMHPLSNSADLEEVIASTRKGETVIVGVSQKELKDVLDGLKSNGYNVVDKEKIHRKYNVYAVTIDLKNKDNSGFFEAVWNGQ